MMAILTLSQFVPTLAVAGFSTGQLMTGAILAVMVASAMILSRRRSRNAAARPCTPVRAQYSRVSQAAPEREDIEQAVLELDKVARQIHAQLDTKFAKLEAIIRHADARIEQLTRLADGASRAGLDITVGIETPCSPAPVSTAPPVNDWDEAVRSLAAQGKPSREIARETGRPIGEIELILALQKARRRQPALTDATVA